MVLIIGTAYIYFRPERSAPSRSLILLDLDDETTKMYELIYVTQFIVRIWQSCKLTTKLLLVTV